MVKRVSLEKPKMGVLEYLALIIVLIFFMFPIYWLLITSFKPKMEWLVSPPYWFPRNPTILNYLVILFPIKEGVEMVLGSYIVFKPATKAFIDSAIVAGLGTILAVVVGLLAAFAVSRHNIGGNSFMGLVLMLRMAPPMVAIVPLIVFYSLLGFVDTYHGLILAYATFTMPYAVWIIKSFIDEVPRELEDSARLDGLSPLAAHFKITLPLIKGGIFATTLFIWILNWSEYLFALLLTHGNVVTLPVQITAYQTYAGLLYGPQAALAILAVIPLVVFGTTIRRYLARGLTFGAIRG
ncbi:carbohydrate ABC transporter permease [Candidatus Bathyarchaeota archaeon]|nr:MAG: carbohydrate ABC transporter permease [Candidatus Bathyarchaeota archaeon]